MLLPSNQTTGDLHLSGTRKIADVINALLLYLHSYKKLQEVEKKRQNFYPYRHYKVIHGVPYQYLASFIAMYSKEGKVHPRTGHKGPEGEERYSSTLSLTSALDGSGWSTPHPGRFTPGKGPVPIV